MADRRSGDRGHGTDTECVVDGTAPASESGVPASMKPRMSKPPKVKVNRCKDSHLSVHLPDLPKHLLGTDDPDAVNALLNQLVGALRPARGQPLDEVLLNQLLALLHGIGPTDGVEGMLAVQMVACQHAAMDVMRRAMHPDQTAEGRRLYLNLATRLMATFSMQADALNRGRGRGTVQRVVVERVNVAPGGQAIVGAVANRGGGDDRHD